MSYEGPPVFRKAVGELSKLPGVGEKTAQRLVFHLVHAEESSVQALSTALTELKSRLRLCSVCAGLTDDDPCPICRDPKRDPTLMCVVEDPSDVFAVERSGQFRGVYHVLHGSLRPLDGIGPKELTIELLMRRVDAVPPREVVLATNPDVTGEATAVYLARLLRPKGIRTSRIAMGIPLGSHLEYTDQITLGRAISERRDFSTP